jgi:4'-phosphopantetheinyl transferase
LGACLDVDAAALMFGYQTRGKPVLSQVSSPDDVRFNLSHSGRLVAVALARGRDVGVDIESIHRVTDWSLLADRIFSPRDLCELRALPASQQREAFFSGWTRKEAYLKATGEGLIDALPSIEVTIDPEHTPRLRNSPGGPDAARQWALRAIPLPPDFAGAVAFDQRPAPDGGLSQAANGPG